MSNLAAAGAGASEGLEQMFSRLMVQDKLDEQKREAVANEGLKSRGLDIDESYKNMQGQSISDLRKAQQQKILDDQASERERQANEDDYLASAPAGDPGAAFLKLRRTVQKGEQVPYQIITGLKPSAPKSSQSKGMMLRGQHVPVDFVPGEDGGGKYMYRGEDVTNDPTLKEYEPPATQFIQSGDSYAVGDKRSGTVKPAKVAGTDNPVPLAAPQQVRTRADQAKRVAAHIDDITSEADAMNRLGLMGPVGGRWSDFASGKWGSAADVAQLLGHPLTPEQESALSEFRDDVGFLKSGMAMVHGGTRGGGSPAIMTRMDAMMNAGRMDLPGMKGALKSFKKWLNGYADLSPDATQSMDSTNEQADYEYINGKVVPVKKQDD